MNDASCVLSRLSPLPKKIEVWDAARVRPSDLVIGVCGADVWAQRAARELADFVEALCGVKPPVTRGDIPGGRVSIRLVPDSDQKTFAPAFQEPFFDDFTASPGFQAYRMAMCAPSSRGLILQGLSAEGVYWGMKTLKQLIRFERGELTLPRVRIVDGADMEDRGLWCFGAPACASADREEVLAYHQRWVDWMSDHKLNLMNVVAFGEIGGAGFRSRKHPEFCCEHTANQEYLLKRLIPYGEERGLRMVPAFTHSEHFGFVVRKFPQLASAHSVRHHGEDAKIPVDFFRKETASVLLDLAEEVMALCNPRELCFWLAESRLHCLPPHKQHKSQFLQEAEIYYGIVEKLRSAKPDLSVMMALTQGSFPENLALIRAMPKDIKWIYYSGERFGTYNIRPRNPIHRDIVTAAREGYWVCHCLPLCGVPARPAWLSRLHANIGHAVAAGLRGLYTWSMTRPADEMATFVAAEQTWNSAGRSLDECLRAYAAAKGAADPDRQARAYRLYDDANGAQGARDSISIGQPFGNFSRYSNMLERIRDNDKVDELLMHVVDRMEDDELPALAQAAADLEQAMAAADAKQDKLFALRCRYLLHTVRISRCIAQAFYINGREKCWDLYKGDWDDFRAELRKLLAAIQVEVKASTPVYRRLVRLEQWSQRAGPFSTRDRPNPLEGVGELAQSIEVSGVTTSRDL